MLSLDDLLEYTRLTQPKAPYEPMDKVLALADDSPPPMQWRDPPKAPDEPLTTTGPMVSPGEVEDSWSGQNGTRPLDPEAIGKDLIPPPSMQMALSPAGRSTPSREEYPSESGAGGGKAPDGIDPSLAFWAAFSKNPVLQQMLSEQQNAPAKAAAEKRAQEKWQLERDLMTPLKAEKTRAEIGRAGLKEADSDPASEQSRATREGVSRALQMHATRMASVDQDLAKQMQAAASSMLSDKISGKQALAMAGQFGGVAGAVAKDALAAAERASKEAYQKQTLAQGWASEEEKKRHNMAIEDQAENKMQLTMLKPQEHLNSQINDLDQALSNMKQISELKKDVNTGVYVDGIANFVNKWIDSGLTSSKRNELSALLARVFNKETKTLAGSAVTPSEWARIAPQIPQTSDDDELFVTKLSKAIQISNEILQKRREEYQMRGGGTPVDTSTTAKKNVRAAQRSGERPLPDQTPASPKPAADAKTQAAKAWLQANPNDPKAAAVRKRLQAMGAL